MKESRTKKQPEGDTEISAWVSKSRKLEKKRALQLSKIFEEQVFPHLCCTYILWSLRYCFSQFQICNHYNMLKLSQDKIAVEGSDDEDTAQHTGKFLCFWMPREVMMRIQPSSLGHLSYL